MKLNAQQQAFATDFGEFLVRAIIAAGGSRSTAHKVASLWFEAFDEPTDREDADRSGGK